MTLWRWPESKLKSCCLLDYNDNDNHVNHVDHDDHYAYGDDYDYDDHVNVYQVLTIGDTTYINDERYAIEKPIRHDVSCH